MTAIANPLPSKYGDFDFPRRAVVEAMHRAEQAIRNAMHEVEHLGADPLLTDAGTKLIAAKDLVSDWLEGKTGLAAQLAAPIAQNSPYPHICKHGCERDSLKDRIAQLEAQYQSILGVAEGLRAFVQREQLAAPTSLPNCAKCLGTGQVLLRGKRYGSCYACGGSGVGDAAPQGESHD